MQIHAKWNYIPLTLLASLKLITSSFTLNDNYRYISRYAKELLEVNFLGYSCPPLAAIVHSFDNSM